MITAKASVEHRRYALLSSLCVVGLILQATSAQAQSTSVVTAPTNTVRLNADDCSSSNLESLYWELGGDGNVDVYWTLILQSLVDGENGNCRSPNVGQALVGDVIVERTQERTDGNGLLQIEPAIERQELLPEGFCESGDRGSYNLCLYVQDLNLNVFGTSATSVQVDTAVPSAPSIASVTEGDGRVLISVADVDDSGGDNYTYILYYRACSAGSDAGVTSTDAGVDSETTCDSPNTFSTTESTDAESLVISDLTNNVTYEIGVALRDDFDNESEISELETITPRDSLSPLELYDGTPNDWAFTPEDCSQASLSSWWVLFPVLMARRVARRRGQP